MQDALNASTPIRWTITHDGDALTIRATEGMRERSSVTYNDRDLVIQAIEKMAGDLSTK